MFIFQLNQAEHHYLAILSFVLALPWPLLLHWLTNNYKKAHPNQSYEDGKQEEKTSENAENSSKVYIEPCMQDDNDTKFEINFENEGRMFLNGVDVYNRLVGGLRG